MNTESRVAEITAIRFFIFVESRQTGEFPVAYRQASRAAATMNLQNLRRRSELVGRAPTIEGENDDAELMRKIAARDEAALAVIYDRHSGTVYALLRRVLRDSSDAEDILQDVFFHLWKVAGKYDGERGSLRGWLLTIARNRAISLLRQRKPMESEEAIETRPMLEVRGIALSAANDMAISVERARKSLSSDQNELFEMAFYEGMSHSEIAERTGQPLGTIKTRLRTAVTTLRQALQT